MQQRGWMERVMGGMKRIGALGVTLAALHAGPASAEQVIATFEGPVSEDSDLGLSGQTMTLTLTYEDTAAPSFGTDIKFYVGAVTAATLTIGTHTWTFARSPDTDSILLSNDALQSFSAGVEDSFQVLLNDFSGPDLGTAPPGEPLAGEAFSLNLFLYDAVPSGSPDALETSERLPNPAPDIDDFSNPARTFGDRVMQFEWTVGDAELGTRYVIATRFAAVEAPAAPQAVPVLPLAGMGLLSGLIAGIARAQAVGSSLFQSFPWARRLRLPQVSRDAAPRPHRPVRRHG